MVMTAARAASRKQPLMAIEVKDKRKHLLRIC